MTSLGASLTSSFPSERLNSIQESVRGAAASTGLHHVGRNLAEHVSDHVEHLDFFSENTIGACVTCCISLLIWLVALPIFHLGAVPWMDQWEAMHAITLPEYMGRAEETYGSPHAAFKVLDPNGDGNSTFKDFQAGSALFKRPPFRYPADVYPVFGKIDANSDGIVQDSEFYRAAPSGMEWKWHINMTDFKARTRESYGYLESYYTAMDRNSDGQVTRKEFTTLAADLEPPVPEEDAKELFDKADHDGSGFVEPREWVSYNVSGLFSFPTTLAPGVLPEGPRVMLAVEAGLRAALRIMQFEVLVVNGVAKQEAVAVAPSRRLQTVAQSVVLRVTFTVFVGTTSRQSQMAHDVTKLPDDTYTAVFDASISGGSTTALPPGVNPTAPPEQTPGPLSADDLQAYLNVPAVIQGRTELLLGSADAATDVIADQEAKTGVIFKSSFDAFCECSITVESAQTEAMQDQMGGAATSRNTTLVISWSTDLQHGGKFEQRVQDTGQQLISSIFANIMKANLPSMKGVTLDSWTRFTATYYGEEAAKLPRGTAIKQYLGNFRTMDKGVRDDTGTPPFVVHP